MSANSQGCVFFNFGSVCIVNLIVSLSSLRQVYSGNVAVFMDNDELCRLAAEQLKDWFNVEIRFFNKTKSDDECTLKIFALKNSPYQQTVIFDSDLLFLKPITELFDCLNNSGRPIVAAEYFFPAHPCIVPPDGFPYVGRINELLSKISPPAFSPALLQKAVAAMESGIDFNVGMVGYNRVIDEQGHNFLSTWEQKVTEIRQGRRAPIIEEMVFAALYPAFENAFHIVPEKYNCPAHGYFRKTELNEAHVLHYFWADRLDTIPNILWYKQLEQVRKKYDMDRWLTHSFGLLLDYYRLKKEKPLSEDAQIISRSLHDLRRLLGINYYLITVGNILKDFPNRCRKHIARALK